VYAFVLQPYRGRSIYPCRHDTFAFFLSSTLTLETAVGTESFHGYSEPFLTPNQQTKRVIRLYRAARHSYISICSPASCSPYYCCRTLPLVAFLLHLECVQTLLNNCHPPMCAIWSLVRCTQPSYAAFESVGTAHQVRSITAAISTTTNFVSFPPKMSAILQGIQKLPLEIQHMNLGSVGPGVGLSQNTVMLATLPLLKGRRTLLPTERRFELCCSKKIM